MKNRILWVLVAVVTVEGLVAAGYFWGRRAAPSPATVVRTDPAGEGPRRRGDEVETAALARRIREDGDSQRAEIVSPSQRPSSDEERPPAAPLSPAEARDQEIAKLRSSGPDDRNLITSARKVGAAWTAAMRERKLEVTFNDWECHTAGCFVTAASSSTNTLLNEFTEQITHSSVFNRWNGTKMRTSPVTLVNHGGRSEVTWVLFSPPLGEDALAPASAFPETNAPAHASTP